MIINSPTVQSPKAYDLINLQAAQLGARLAAGANATMRGNLRTAIQDGAYTYLIHPAETANGLVDADITFGFIPCDPRRYGGDPSGVAFATAAVQKAIDVAVTLNSAVYIGHGCKFKCDALSKTFSGNHTTNSVRICGESQVGSHLVFSTAGAPAAFISLLGSTPTGNPQEIEVIMENITLEGPLGGSIDGIKLEGVALVQMRTVIILGFAAAVNLHSALDVVLEGCQFYNNIYGVFCRTDGAGSPDNRVKLHNCTFAGCGTVTTGAGYGLDYDGGSHLFVEFCDFEGCGVNNNNTTGAIHIGANVNNTLGEAVIAITRNWFEGNLGWGVKVESPASGSLHLALRDNMWLGDNLGSLWVLGAQQMQIQNCAAIGLGVFNLTCNRLTMQNVTVNTLTDGPVTWPTYHNVTTGAGHQYSGRLDSGINLTPTGLTAPAATATNFVQQGDEVTIEFPNAITGVSNTTAFTLTGVPAKYQPASVQRGLCYATNNGIDQAIPVELDPASGTITFNFTFTNTGAKGVPAGASIRYKLAA
jgi:hypothetical protein